MAKTRVTRVFAILNLPSSILVLFEIEAYAAVSSVFFHVRRPGLTT